VKNVRRFSTTSEPPYYAVIFTSMRTEGDAGYGETSARMEALAREMPGYLGIESARGTNGFGIPVSYWSSEAAIAEWKRHVEQQAAQSRGKREWYAGYQVRVAKVERARSTARARESQAR
jgi:heme-degrading monooxygenase HmoA